MPDVMDRFLLTDDMARFIRLQRTCFAKDSVDDLAVKYFRGCNQDYKDIAPHLDDESPGQILDIGCGMGGVDVLLHHKLPSHPDLYLFDINADPAGQTIRYGYSTDPAAYNHLELTREFALLNGVDSKNICILHQFPAGIYFDLVISIISMGFHYPVETYLDGINTRRLILDIRKTASEQKMALAAKFKTLDIIRITEKYERILCENP